jgi:hypothetical protein
MSRMMIAVLAASLAIGATSTASADYRKTARAKIVDLQRGRDLPISMSQARTGKLLEIVPPKGKLAGNSALFAPTAKAVTVNHKSGWTWLDRSIKQDLRGMAYYNQGVKGFRVYMMPDVRNAYVVYKLAGGKEITYVKGNTINTRFFDDPTK